VKKNLGSFVTDLWRASLLLWRVDKKITIINFAMQAIQALLSFLTLYYLKLMLDAVVQPDRSFNSIIPLIAAFGGVQFISALITQYSTYINTIYQEKLTDFLSSEVLVKAIAVDYEYYETPEYHDTLHLAQQQSVSRISQLFNNFNSIVQNTLSMVALIGYFFTLHSLFALFFILLSVPLALVKWYSGVALHKQQKEFVPLEREANYLHQTLTGISTAKEVRVFGFGPYFINKFRNMRLFINREKRKLNLKFMRYSLMSEALGIIVMAVVFGILAKQAWSHIITVGALGASIAGFQRLESTSNSFLQSWVQLFQQRLFLRDIFAFFDIQPRSEPAYPVPFPKDGKGLTVNNVSFKYPGTDRVALKDVSIKCEPGKVVAIVGENGSGKSTLVKLLARLYDIQSGSICFDDNRIEDISLADLRKNSIFLFQDFEKYYFTLEENIAIGEEKFDLLDVEHAAGLSGAHPFISQLKQGYKTRMGRMFTGSEQLSGGQWQKVALARIFYKKAQLVVLDEPTSALDANAELELYRNIKEQFKDKMVILITHRLYNLKIADHIYLMQQGSIIEEGSLEELVRKGGIFNSMYNAQKL